MGLKNDYYGQCATCNRYMLGSTTSLDKTSYLSKSKGEVGFKCSQYSACMALNDSCCHYSRNSRVGDGDISSAQKQISKFKKEQGCFITTAICSILGFADNCYYLETLRHFRKNILQENEIYYSLLHHYDTVGPEISDALLDDPEQWAVANSILTDYIRPCCVLVEQEKNEDAVQIYFDMTSVLAQKYGIKNEFIENVRISKEEARTKGFGRVRRKKC